MPAWQLRALTGGAFLVAAILLFARLGDLPLIDPDEGRNAEVAREMAETGAWVVPSFNGIPYLDKPALYFRAVALSFTIFGRNEFTARLPSALSAALLAVLMWAFCRRAYGERAGALTVLVLATTPLVVGFARLVIFDMPLALFTTMAIVAGYRAEERDSAVTCRRWLLVGAASSAVATLIKGPVGFLVPAAVLTVFSLVERRPRAILRMLAPRNLALFLAIVLPWFLALVHAHPEFLRYGLVEESARRFLTPSFRRTEPVYYFGPVLLLGDVSVERAVARGGGGRLAAPCAVDAGRPVSDRVGGGRRRLLLELAVEATGLHPPGRRRPGRLGRAPLRSRSVRIGWPGGPPGPPRHAGGGDPQHGSGRGALAQPRQAERSPDPPELREQRVRPTGTRSGRPRRVVAGRRGRGLRSPAVARRQVGAGGVRAPRSPVPIGRLWDCGPICGGKLGTCASEGHPAIASRLESSPVWSVLSSGCRSTSASQ